MAGKKQTDKKRRSRGSASMDLRVVAAAVVLLGAALATWFMWAGPALSATSAANDKIAAVEQEVAQAQAKIATLRSGQVVDSSGLLYQARDLDVQLPAEIDKVTLAASVPTAAAERGLSVERMDPAVEPERGAQSGSLTFSVSVSGPHDAVLDFLGELTSPSNPNGLMTIDALQLSVSSTSTSATFELHAHHATTPDLAPSVNTQVP